MNLTNAKKIIHKIEALLQTLDNSDRPSRLEQDLLRSYVLNLYESLFDETVIKTEVPSRPGSEDKPEVPDSHGFGHPQKDRPQFKAPEPKQSGTSELSEKQQEIKPAEHREVTENPPSKEEIEQHGLKELEERQDEPPEMVEPPAEDSAPVSQVGNGLGRQINLDKVASLFDLPKAQELSERLGSRPLPRIEAGLGINERILTINELFNGDKAAFDKTLARLNELSSFEEAKAYLLADVAGKFRWDEDDKYKKAAHFIRLVRRRYLQDAS